MPYTSREIHLRGSDVKATCASGIDFPEQVESDDNQGGEVVLKETLGVGWTTDGLSQSLRLASVLCSCMLGDVTLCCVRPGTETRGRGAEKVRTYNQRHVKSRNHSNSVE